MGEDIRKQLPKETAEFDMVNSGWKEIMTRMNDNPNAKEATHHPGSSAVVFFVLRQAKLVL